MSTPKKALGAAMRAEHQRRHASTDGPWDRDWWASLLRDLHNFAPDFLWEFRDGYRYPGMNGNDTADAHLIAAAPALYDALRFALSDESGFACPAATEARLRAALASADGETA